MNRYIVGVFNGKVAGRPSKCLFTRDEESLEGAVFMENKSCEFDMGTMESLMKRHHESDVSDFEEDEEV
jgi:hypothetical protein